MLIEADLGDLGHSTAREIFGFLFVAVAEGHTGVRVHVHSRYGAKLAEDLRVLVGRLRTILTNFGVAMVIETLKRWLSVLLAGAGDFLTDRLNRDIHRGTRMLLQAFVLIVVFSCYFVPKLFHLGFSRVDPKKCKLDR